MTPEAFLARRARKLRLVIFDCDGVLVDSEGIANVVTARWISQLGWPVTAHDCDHLFLGMSLDDMMPMIETRVGAIPAGWRAAMMDDFLLSLGREVIAIEGAVAALDAITAIDLPWRIASNSSHAEMDVKFARIGIAERAQGRIHSFQDVPRGKPAPDLFLATALAEGVDPAACLVIEDSANGARAARAAGMDCLGYAPLGHDIGLLAEGAVPFRSMYDLPALLSAAQRIPT